MMKSNAEGSRSYMKRSISIAALAACGAVAWGSGMLRETAVRAQGGSAALYDWAIDGGDTQRTGWNKQETTLTKENVKDLKLLWKMSTANQVRALHSLMPVIVAAQLNTSQGVKQVGFLAGISDNLYA